MFAGAALQYAEAPVERTNEQRSLTATTKSHVRVRNQLIHTRSSSSRHDCFAAVLEKNERLRSRQDLSCETPRPLHTETDSRVVHVPSQVLRVHDVVRATVGLPGDDRDLRHRGLGVGKQQLQRSRGSDLREGEPPGAKMGHRKTFQCATRRNCTVGARDRCTPDGSRLEKSCTLRDANAHRARTTTQSARTQRTKNKVGRGVSSTRGRDIASARPLVLDSAATVCSGSSYRRRAPGDYRPSTSPLHAATLTRPTNHNRSCWE